MECDVTLTIPLPLPLPRHPSHLQSPIHVRHVPDFRWSLVLVMSPIQYKPLDLAFNEIRTSRQRDRSP